MRKLIQMLVAFITITYCIVGYSQVSTPTFSATDPDSQTWNNGTYSVVLVSSSGQAVPQGQAIRVDTGATVTVSVSSQTLNGSGAGSITLVNNSNINPAGTQWRFNVCSNTLPQFCGTSTLAISSSSSISTQISASLPAPRIGGGIGAQGYADVEASATPNNSYYNVTTSSCRLYTSSWGACGGGGGSLPTATAAGQVPVYTGPGTTATAQFTSPAGKVFYLANYLANPTVPTQVRWDCSWGTGSSPQTITCPTGTFTSSMTGWIAWATQLGPGGNAPVANNFACGTAGTNPTLTYVSSTTATINTACSVASVALTSGGSTFVFGPDETSGVDSWITAVANACGTGVLPKGTVLTEHGGGGWNLTAAQNQNCGLSTGTHTAGPIIVGQGISASTVGIEPAFLFSTCTGGPTTNTCFGSATTPAGVTGVLGGGYSFSDFSISGFGSTLDASSITNWVEMLYSNYANNFAITKLSGTTTANTVGIKMSGTFGQFWNMISDTAGAVPCWVAGGKGFSPNVIGGASECVGGSGEAVTAICTACATYGLLVTSNGWAESNGTIYAGGNTTNVASDITISGGNYTGYGDSTCCNNSGSVMGIIGFSSAGGTLTLDGFTGDLFNMGNGSHFIFSPGTGAPYISLRNTNVTIGGGTGQQCYTMASGTLVDGGNNVCNGASSASTFSTLTPLSLISPLTAAQGGTGNALGGGMVLISNQTLASTATSVTFSSIPQTFKHLKIVGSFEEGGGGGNLYMQLNGDTGAHYGWSYYFNNAGTPTASGNENNQTFALISIGTSGMLSMEIGDYSGTVLPHTYFSATNSALSTNNTNAGTSGVYANQGSAITSVKLYDQNGASFSIGSTFSLYGMQ